MLEAATSPFGDLPAGGFACILADPPWAFRARSAKGYGKAPQRHYPCMDLEAIQELPVASLAAPACALFMWATSPLLPQAMATMAAWGFAYKGVGAWAKRSPRDRAWHCGTGYIMRSTAEFYLLGTRGAPRRQSASVRNLIVAPVREHSRKPDEMRQDVERLYGGPYLELFARQPAPNWTSWGNDTARFAPELLAAD